jgi:hypothetical protein
MKEHDIYLSIDEGALFEKFTRRVREPFSFPSEGHEKGTL